MIATKFSKKVRSSDVKLLLWKAGRPQCNDLSTSSTLARVQLPVISTLPDLKVFVKHPDLQTYKAIVFEGTKEFQLPQSVHENNEQLNRMGPESIKAFPDGALYALESVTGSLHKCLHDDTKEEGLQQLDLQMTERCRAKIPDVLSDIHSRCTQSQIDLIPISQDEVYFSWVTEMRLLGHKDLRIRFCTFSLKGLPAIKTKLQEQQNFMEELQKNRTVFSGRSFKESMEMADEIKKKMVNPKTLVRENPILITNIGFILDQNDEWKVDELTIVDSIDALSKFGLYRYNMRLAITLQRNVPYLNVLRFDYVSDMISLFFIQMAIFLLLLR